MNISNYQKFLPCPSHCFYYTEKTCNPNWSLTKTAAFLTGIFLSYAISKKLQDDPEITAYKKALPHAVRLLLGFGPLKKASAKGLLSGPFCRE